MDLVVPDASVILKWALAIVFGGVFVTADERYARIAASHGAVVTLGEWEPGNGGPGNRKR